MKPTKFVFHVAAGAAAFLALTASAWADVPVIFSSAITGTVYRVCGNFLDALTAAPGSATCSSTTLGQLVANEGTFTTTEIYFNVPPLTTLGDFLTNNNPGSGTIDSGMTGLASLMSNCQSSGPASLTVGGVTCYSTVIHITGPANVFQAGVKYTLTHDDGALLSETVGGNVVNSIGPTSAFPSSWTQGAIGTGNFDLWYMGTNENPEVLQLTGGAVPEPTSILLFGGLLVGLAGALKRRFA
jgi:hypothetical protein